MFFEVHLFRKSLLNIVILKQNAQKIFESDFFNYVELIDSKFSNKHFN